MSIKIFTAILSLLLSIQTTTAAAEDAAPILSEADLSPQSKTCTTEGARTLLAAMGRDQKTEKQQFLGQLPALRSNSPRHVRVLHDILDDVYRLSDLNKDALYYYRFQICRIELVSGLEIQRDKTLESRVLDCQRTHSANENVMSECILKEVLDRYNAVGR